MGRKVRWIVIALLAVILAGVACGLVWHGDHYVMIGYKFYAKDTREMDLRGQELSPSEHDRIQRRLPDCRILWDVPFQDGRLDCDIEELTVQSLSQDDVMQLRYFPNLKELHGEECPDLNMLLMAEKTYPGLQVSYQVPIGGQSYHRNTRVLELENITQGDISLLDYLRELETVSLSGAEDIAAARALQDYCEDRGLVMGIMLGQEVYDQNATSLSVSGITSAQLHMLQLMPRLEQVHIREPQAPAAQLLDLRKRGGLTVTWEKTIWGKTYTDDARQVDLSEGVVGTLEEVEEGMTYLPEAEQLFLGLCQLDNEQIAAYRERSRDQFKVVWIVDLSGKMQVRTDITNFMPSRDGWYYVRDHEIDNIRYCEDLICMDIGHMGIKDVSFLETLVNLEYLILAHTEVQYVDAIVNCKKLKFLELDWTPIKDVSPLVELTALEDLNLGKTWPDITPILQMTWLKNLYLINGNARANFPEHLPDTRVVTSGEATVSNGWRNLPNYYAMRDILGMYYM